MLLWGFLGTFALFFMHVQVVTRLISACPALYWWAAHLLLQTSRKPGDGPGAELADGESSFRESSMTFTSALPALSGRRLAATAVLAWFVGYSLLGCVLFSNFHNWT